MTLISLQALTWGTVTGAVVSALLLASGEVGVPEWSRMRRSEPSVRPSLPISSAHAEERRREPAPHAVPVAEKAQQRELQVH
jgi:hypothetical protein